MCLTCAIEEFLGLEEGQPVPDNWREIVDWPDLTPEMREAVLLVRRLYNESSGLGAFTGSHLHIYTDDFNCDDESLEWLRKARDEGRWSPETADVRADEERYRVCSRILDISLPLSERQRTAIISSAHYNLPALGPVG